MKKGIFFFSILIFTNIGAVIAQNDFKKHDKWITHYPSNIDLPFSNDELKKIEEAYGLEFKKEILTNRILLKDIKDILRNRVEVFNAEKKNISSITNLSTLPLYNSKLLLKAFDPNNFNPLLYEFDFYTKSNLVYRVDNTSYLIFIKPRELR